MYLCRTSLPVILSCCSLLGCVAVLGKLHVADDREVRRRLHTIDFCSLFVFVVYLFGLLYCICVIFVLCVVCIIIFLLGLLFLLFIYVLLCLCFVIDFTSP